LPPSRTTGVLSVHEARHALGQRLRELRQQAGLTGRQVADSPSWPASKVSRLENGRQTPTDEDVRAWASVTHAGAETEALLALLQAHLTPVQRLNRATDPFLPAVRPHTLAVLADLDGRGLRNHVLVITRHRMKPSAQGARRSPPGCGCRRDATRTPGGNLAASVGAPG
jgi:transcriptional regulator with XRE-family HTH domain